MKLITLVDYSSLKLMPIVFITVENYTLISIL